MRIFHVPKLFTVARAFSKMLPMEVLWATTLPLGSTRNTLNVVVARGGLGPPDGSVELGVRGIDGDVDVPGGSGRELHTSPVHLTGGQEHEPGADAVVAGRVTRVFAAHDHEGVDEPRRRRRVLRDEVPDQRRNAGESGSRTARSLVRPLDAAVRIGGGRVQLIWGCEVGFDSSIRRGPTTRVGTELLRHDIDGSSGQDFARPTRGSDASRPRAIVARRCNDHAARVEGGIGGDGNGPVLRARVLDVDDDDAVSRGNRGLDAAHDRVGDLTGAAESLEAVDGNPSHAPCVVAERRVTAEHTGGLRAVVPSIVVWIQVRADGAARLRSVHAISVVVDAIIEQEVTPSDSGIHHADVPPVQAQIEIRIRVHERARIGHLVLRRRNRLHCLLDELNVGARSERAKLADRNLRGEAVDEPESLLDFRAVLRAQFEGTPGMLGRSQLLDLRHQALRPQAHCLVRQRTSGFCRLQRWEARDRQGFLERDDDIDGRARTSRALGQREPLLQRAIDLRGRRGSDDGGLRIVRHFSHVRARRKVPTFSGHELSVRDLSGIDPIVRWTRVQFRFARSGRLARARPRA